MIEEKQPLLDILTALNYHFPAVLPDDEAVAQRKALKVRHCKIHFRKLVLRMIRDEAFRKNYVKNTLHLEYGDKYMAVLEKLLWEFLCRLQTVLNQQVPQTRPLLLVDEDNLSSTPIHPSSGLNFSEVSGVINTKKMWNPKEKKENPRSHNVTANEKQEENLNTVQAQYKEQQNHPKNRHGYGRCEDTGQSISQDLMEETDITRTLHFTNSPTAAGNGEYEPLPPYFEIFGFDCSQSSKVNHCRSLSPPDPLQSQSLNPDCVSDPQNRLTDIQITDVALTNHSPISSGEENSPHEGQSKTLAHELMSWRYQPRVHLTKLPLNIINMYQDQVADSQESQSESIEDSGSWFWLCSEPTDNDSCDPDYLPQHSFFHHVGEQLRRIQPRRGLRLSSLQ
ncbi:hypothetical protein GDO81_015838 [Engystomops pustulosus]|uniref:TERF1-interacting nuclear factor 2 N-terminal domain-containing protein n=1 Tax=Engystomops pustulosus TaxID=76066 RepID=A0AAV7ANU3_ENGPU|nr:hypothetical protein GDO81_015838 [Engystomops pustulosus]